MHTCTNTAARSRITPSGGGQLLGPPAAEAASAARAADSLAARRAAAVLLAILAALALSLALAAPAFADTGTIYETADGTITDDTSAPIVIEYSTDENGATITKVRATTANCHIVIPEQIGGFDVVTMGVEAIYGWDGSVGYKGANVVSISFPKTVKTLEARSCNNLTKLTSVTFAEGSVLENIGAGAFSGAVFTSIDLPDTVKHIDRQAFYNIRSLESFTFPASYSDTKLADQMFRDCGSLGVVAIPACVEEVGSWAFYECKRTVNGVQYNGPAGIVVLNPSTVFASNAFQDANEELPVHGWKLSEGKSTAETLAGNNAGYTFIPFAVFSDYELTYTSSGEPVTTTMPVTAEVVVDAVPMPSSGDVVTPDVLVTVTDSKGAKQTISCATDDSADCVVEYIDNTYVEGQEWAGKVKVTGKSENYTFGEATYDIVLLEPGIAPEGSLFEYQFSTEGGMNTAIVTGVTDAGAAATELAIPATVEYNGVTYAVTSIREQAFNGATLAASTISLPSTLQSIGAKAFMGSSIQSIAIPAGVTSIGFEAFADCANLSSIAFDAESTFDIGTSFSGMTSLTTLILPGKATELAPAALKGCSALTSITIPDSVTIIGANAFQDCAELTAVTFGEASGLTTIGAGAFAGCEKIETLYVPKGVTDIGGVDYGGYASTALYPIPNIVFDAESDLELGKILAKASAGTDNADLKSIVLPGKMVGTGFSAQYCTGLESVVIPSTMTTLPLASFRGCTSLKDVTLPSTLTEIANNVFWDCNALASIELPEGLQTIGSSFLRASAVTEVILPSTVTSLGNNAFRDASVVSLTVLNPATTFGNNVYFAEEATVYGWPGSTAEALAANKSVKFVPFKVIGDYEVGGVAVGSSYDVTAPSAVAMKEGGATAADISVAVAASDAYAAAGLPELVAGTDYAVSIKDVYGRDVDKMDAAGDYKVVVSGVEDKQVYGSFEAPVRYMAQVDLSAATLSLAESSVLLGPGGTVVPEPELAAAGIDSGDWELKVFDAQGAEVEGGAVAAPGSYTAKAVAASDACTGETAAVGFTALWDLSQGAVEVSGEPALIGSDGAAAVPAGVAVKFGDAVLTAETDYMLTYSGNDKAGTATARAEGVGSYAGIASAEFAVKYDISTAKVEAEGAVLPAEGAATPRTAVVLKVGDEEQVLVENVDYELAFEGADAVGTAKVKAVGIGSYAGETAQAEFPVQGSLAFAEISAADAELPAGGGAATTSVAVTFRGQELAEGSDYALVYEGNRAVGTATVTAIGKGAYTGNVSAEFQVTSAAPSVESASGEVDIAGDTRFGTAAAVATAAYPSGSDAIVVANGWKFPDALSASGLAGALDAPILTTDAKSLPADTIAGVLAMKAGKASIACYIVGDESSVSAAAAAQLAALCGGEPVRIAGADRFATALAIHEVGKQAGSWGETAIVVSGTGFADAASLSGYANWAKAPVILTRAAALPAGAAEALAGYSRIVVAGGEGSVSAGVFAELESIAGEGNVVRLAGADRYETSAAVAEWCLSEGMSMEHVAIANGEQAKGGADALASSSLQGRTGSVMLLVSATKVCGKALELLESACGTAKTVTYLGGLDSISQAVRDLVNATLGFVDEVAPAEPDAGAPAEPDSAPSGPSLTAGRASL